MSKSRNNKNNKTQSFNTKPKPQGGNKMAKQQQSPRKPWQKDNSRRNAKASKTGGRKRNIIPFTQCKPAFDRAKISGIQDERQFRYINSNGAILDTADILYANRKRQKRVFELPLAVRDSEGEFLSSPVPVRADNGYARFFSIRVPLMHTDNGNTKEVGTIRIGLTAVYFGRAVTNGTRVPTLCPTGFAEMFYVSRLDVFLGRDNICSETFFRNDDPLQQAVLNGVEASLESIWQSDQVSGSLGVVNLGMMENEFRAIQVRGKNFFNKATIAGLMAELIRFNANIVDNNADGVVDYTSRGIFAVQSHTGTVSARISDLERRFSRLKGNVDRVKYGWASEMASSIVYSEYLTHMLEGGL